MKSGKGRGPEATGKKAGVRLKKRKASLRTPLTRGEETETDPDEPRGEHAKAHWRPRERYSGAGEADAEKRDTPKMRNNRFNEGEDGSGNVGKERLQNPFLVASIKSPTNPQKESNKNIFQRRASLYENNGNHPPAAEPNRPDSPEDRNQPRGQLELDDLINANIQNNIQFMRDMQRDLDAFGGHEQRPDSGEVARAPERPGFARQGTRQRREDLNKSANFQETMSKIFDDLNKTLDVVNLSVERQSKQTAGDSEQDSLRDAPENVFKKKETEEGDSRREKSWFEVTNQIHQQLEESQLINPEARDKTKSKSLIMTDLDEFVRGDSAIGGFESGPSGPPRADWALSENRDEMQKSEQNARSREGDWGEDSDPRKGESGDRVRLGGDQQGGEANKSLDLAKEESFQSQNTKMWKTLPEANKLISQIQSKYQAKDKSKRHEKLHFNPQKGITRHTRDITRHTRDISRHTRDLRHKAKSKQAIPTLESGILSRFVRTRNPVNRLAENRFMTYRKNPFKKFIVKRPPEDSLAKSKVSAKSAVLANKSSFYRIKKARKSANDLGRHGAHFAQSGLKGTLRSARPGGKGHSQALSSSLMKQRPSKCALYPSSRLQSGQPSTAHFRHKGNASNKSIVRLASNLSKACTKDKLPARESQCDSMSQARYQSNLTSISPNQQLRPRRRETPLQAGRIAKPSRFGQGARSQRTQRPHVSGSGDRQTPEHYMASLLETVMAFRIKIEDFKARIYSRNSQFDIRMFVFLLLRSEIPKDVYNYNVFSKFLNRLDLHFTRSQVESLMRYVNRSAAASRRAPESALSLDSRTLFAFFSVESLPRRISRSFCADIGPAEFNLVRRLLLVTMQMIRDVTVLVKCLRPFPIERVFACVVDYTARAQARMTAEAGQRGKGKPQNHSRNMFDSMNKRFSGNTQGASNTTRHGRNSPFRDYRRGAQWTARQREQGRTSDHLESSRVSGGSRVVGHPTALDRFMKPSVYTSAKSANDIHSNNYNLSTLRNAVVDRRIVMGFLQAHCVPFDQRGIDCIMREIGGNCSAFDLRAFGEYFTADFHQL